MVLMISALLYLALSLAVIGAIDVCVARLYPRRAASTPPHHLHVP